MGWCARASKGDIGIVLLQRGEGLPQLLRREFPISLEHILRTGRHQVNRPILYWQKSSPVNLLMSQCPQKSVRMLNLMSCDCTCLIYFSNKKRTLQLN